jgi:hypothetical protein
MIQSTPASARSLLALAIHSTIDLITNSSSELFMLETGKTQDTVKTMFKDLARIWKGEEIDPFTCGWLSPELHVFTMAWDPPEGYAEAYSCLMGFSRGFRHVRTEGEELSHHIYYRMFDRGDRPITNPPGYDPESGETTAEYIDRKCAVYIEELRTRLVPCIDYLVSWCPLLTREAAFTALLLNSTDHFHVFIPEFLAHTRQGGNPWQWPEENDPLDTIRGFLTAAGFPDAAVGYFSISDTKLVGHFVSLVTAEDNSTPYEFIEFIRTILPGARTWHLG